MTVRQGLNIIAGNEVLPTGTIVPYAGATAPDGFLLCDGSAVSGTTYSALFSVIGTTYGEGDGNTTFNLPDSTDRILQGSGLRGVIGTKLNESLPNIRGKVHNGAVNQQSYSWAMNGEGAFFNNYTSTQSKATTAGSQVNCGVDFDASLSSPTYQDNAPVQPDALCIVYIIKF